MAELLQLANGHFSLEFDFAEAEAIRRAVRQIDPQLKVLPRVSYEMLSLRGADILADSDPAGSCLISSSDDGDAVLHRILEAVALQG